MSEEYEWSDDDADEDIVLNTVLDKCEETLDSPIIDEDKLYNGSAGADLPTTETSHGKNDVKPTKPPMKLEVSLDLFGFCDEYPMEEFLTEKELDNLAKEMANHIIWQGNTTEVEEFLTAKNHIKVFQGGS
ncbi:hypothetical protein C8R44DRAFT_871031 [Mycena epipterygia]|nr:hypothetical protein C8R44DRAFT_871031 [Mycena epipterygia]